ncbi:hypothetical protein [Sulfurospirillum arcachonense]|uniref:hypothetical protein n=1 Tax=Sulfurospirillum arcachonense TaxID=57666 RepID=UPI000469AC8E|nr:hypothetical protein [Sulfurospirillum arcachonense]
MIEGILLFSGWVIGFISVFLFLPKRTCPICGTKSIKVVSVMKNLFITNEGSKCNECGSLILINQLYKQILKHPIGLLMGIIFFVSMYLLIPFKELMNETILKGTLSLIALNMIVMVLPLIISLSIYAYLMPIVEGTEKEIKRKNKIGIIGYFIEFGLFFIMLLALFLWI